MSDAAISSKEPAAPAPGRPVRWLRRVGLGLGALLLGGGLCLLPGRPLPAPWPAHPAASAEPMENYLAGRLRQSATEEVRPGNEERLVRRGTAGERAKVAILFVHGYGASRAEGEAVVDPLATELGATVYYTRLPGHGDGMDRHAAVRPEEVFERMEDDFHRVRQLGDKVVLIGSSTGALLCLWLAARHPDDVAAVVASSPLIDFADPFSFLLSRRIGITLIEAAYGPIRDASFRTDPEHRKQPGYEGFWITHQRFRALLWLDGLRRRALADHALGAVRAPVLLLYYYADPAHQDGVISVPAAVRGLAETNGGHPHPLSRAVPIADGNHILLSAYVRTDKQKIRAETRSFLQAALSEQKSQ